MIGDLSLTRQNATHQSGQGTTNLFGGGGGAAGGGGGLFNGNNNNNGASSSSLFGGGTNQGGGSGGLFATSNQLQGNTGGGLFGNGSQPLGSGTNTSGGGGLFSGGAGSGVGILGTNTSSSLFGGGTQGGGIFGGAATTQQGTVDRARLEREKQFRENLYKNYLDSKIFNNYFISSQEFAKQKVTHQTANTLSGFNNSQLQPIPPADQLATMDQIENLITNRIQDIEKLIRPNMKSNFKALIDKLNESILEFKDLESKIDFYGRSIGEIEDQFRILSQDFYEIRQFKQNYESKQLIPLTMPSQFLIYVIGDVGQQIEKLEQNFQEMLNLLAIDEVQAQQSDEQYQLLLNLIENLYEYFLQVSTMVYQLHDNFEVCKSKYIEIKKSQGYDLSSAIQQQKEGRLNSQYHIPNLLNQHQSSVEQIIISQEEKPF